MYAAAPDEANETLAVLQRVMGVRKPKKTLSFLRCLEALDRYVLAGAAAGQFRLSSGFAYIATVKEVAARGKHGVAVQYDELVRTKWAQEAYNSGKTAYPIDAKMCEVDEKCYTMVCNPLASA